MTLAIDGLDREERDIEAARVPDGQGLGVAAGNWGIPVEVFPS